MTAAVFDTAVAADGQLVKAIDPAYPPPAVASFRSSFVDAGRTLSGGNYEVATMLLRWDTSSLPDSCYITSASLYGFITAATNTDGRNATFDWAFWDGSSISDLSITAQTNAHAGTALSSLTAFTYATFALVNGNPYISRTGYTYLRGHIDGGIPTGVNDIEFYDENWGTGATYPQLTVNYGLRTRIAPDAIVSKVNLAGAVTDIQDDPDSPDANHLTYSI